MDRNKKAVEEFKDKQKVEEIKKNWIEDEQFRRKIKDLYYFIVNESNLLSLNIAHLNDRTVSLSSELIKEKDQWGNYKSKEQLKIDLMGALNSIQQRRIQLSEAFNEMNKLYNAKFYGMSDVPSLNKIVNEIVMYDKNMQEWFYTSSQTEMPAWNDRIVEIENRISSGGKL
jgi:hypothetical protein